MHGCQRTITAQTTRRASRLGTLGLTAAAALLATACQGSTTAAAPLGTSSAGNDAAGA